MGVNIEADGGRSPSAFVSQGRNPVGRIFTRRGGLYMIAQAFRPGNRLNAEYALKGRQIAFGSSI